MTPICLIGPWTTDELEFCSTTTFGQQPWNTCLQTGWRSTWWDINNGSFIMLFRKELANLDKFREHQKMMEELNARKRRMLAEAIKQRLIFWLLYQLSIGGLNAQASWLRPEAGDHLLCSAFMTWTGWTVTMWLCHHKHFPCYYILFLLTVKENLQTNMLTSRYAWVYASYLWFLFIVLSSYSFIKYCK